MPVWPKSFYTFGINLRTAATEWKLRRPSQAVAQQERTRLNLTRRLAATSHWKAAGVEAGMAYDQWRSRVALQTYTGIAPAIQRTVRGEADVLWPGRCALFAYTAGTTSGIPHVMPVTEEMMAHVRRAGFDAALYYTVRARHAGVFRGRHLFFGSPPTLLPMESDSGHKAFAGELSGIAALNLPAWAERHLYEPGVAVAAEVEWPARLEAIVARTATRDISLIAGLPNWLLLLAHVLRERCSRGKVRQTSLQSLWPNLECCMLSGLSPTPYLEQLRAVLGPSIVFHEMYAATEACIATQDREARLGLRLMADTGIFFEFLPMADYDPARLEHLGGRAVPLADVKPDVDYALVLTTPGGLARYVLGDIVRFTSLRPPRLNYVGRIALRCDAFSERVNERELTEALTVVCQRRDWLIVNFHVAPRFHDRSLTGQPRGHHEWWVELKPGTVATPTGPLMAGELEIELQRTSESYAARRKAGIMDPPVVRLVMPGVFEHWLRFRRQWGGQHKVPRCRSDRLIADELAQITHFAVD